MSTVDLFKLRTERKFQRTALYTGPDSPEDGVELTHIVNRAIDDVIAMGADPQAAQICARLASLIQEVDLFATEDRERAYWYAERIQRASGIDVQCDVLGTGETLTQSRLRVARNFLMSILRR